MSVNQIFINSGKLAKLNSGPLGSLMDAFCDSLFDDGFTVNTISKHLSNSGHLNQFLGQRKTIQEYPLQEREVELFFKAYPRLARHRGPLQTHIKCVRSSINRLKCFLTSQGLYQKQTAQAPVYQPLLLEYCQWLEHSRNLCLDTIELRERSLSIFFEHIDPVATEQRCAKFCAGDIQDFFIEYSQHHSYHQRRSMQAAVRTFFVFCLQKGYIHQPLDGAVPKLRTYKLATVARGLTDEQALKVLACIDREAACGKRDYAMCLLLYHYGVRGAQVRGLLLEDVHWNQSQILFRPLKHGKSIMLPLTQIIGDSLIDYLQHERPDCPDPHLFLKSRAPYHRLKRSAVLSNVVYRYVQHSGIETNCAGSHALRHTFATRLLAQGNSLKAIADMLGHRHLDSTLHYAKVNFNQLHQVALAWPGRVQS